MNFVRVSIFILLIIIVFLICWFQVPLGYCVHPYDGNPNLLYPTEEKKSNQTINIALVGDSLVLNAMIYFNLIERLHSKLPEYNISFASYSGNGWRISKILQVLYEDILPSKPDAVLLYWDSDVSDVFEIYESKERVAQIRAAYVDRLMKFISVVKASNISLIGVGGPAILGEGIFGLPVDWWAKGDMLEWYHHTTRSVATINGIPYMDARTAFLQALSPLSSHALYCGFLTWDGEHENERGTVILTDLFASAIKNWLDRGN